MMEVNGPALIELHIDHAERTGGDVDLQFVKEICVVTRLYMEAHSTDGQVPWHEVRDSWLRLTPGHSVRWGYTGR